MRILKNKIDFATVIMVNNANPNGDPLNENRPRTTYDGYGEISDVCIKRKIRNRLQDMGEKIFIQSNEMCNDGCRSLAERAKNNTDLVAAQKNKDEKSFAEIACREWMDVRSFGQVFAFKGDSVSVGVRGPVSIHPAFSVLPVDVVSISITKSVNGEDKVGKASDTMGMKHRVSSAMYVLKGSISPQLAEKTGFTEEDAEKVKEALQSLFAGDSSSARPEGSMEVVKVFWWKHNSKIGQYSTSKVHRSLQVEALCDEPKNVDDYKITLYELDGLEVEALDGV